MLNHFTFKFSLTEAKTFIRRVLSKPVELLGGFFFSHILQECLPLFCMMLLVKGQEQGFRLVLLFII